ncbi:MAG: YbhB/YbcL family Raf kinase inhibitor-like protein [Alphaproteobacteria bacterium]|nr:YbhB/YbcL family Raf kinase inhibitor-like protein [Alphaproteobacteria bacterium]
MLEKLPTAVGRALRAARPGMERLAINDAALAEVPETIALTSPAFADGGVLPTRCTADGEGLSPPLDWAGVPDAAAEVVLLIEDADSPTPYPLVHAIVWRLPPGDGSLGEGAMPAERGIGTQPAMGVNSLMRIGYLPPDPPPGHGPHRYAVQVFALRTPVTIDTAAPGRTELIDALNAAAIAKGRLVGTYERP